MGGCGETYCDRGSSVSLSQGDRGPFPKSCSSGTSHSDKYSGGTGSDCWAPSYKNSRGNAWNTGRKSNVCDRLIKIKCHLRLRRIVSLFCPTNA